MYLRLLPGTKAGCASRYICPPIAPRHSRQRGRLGGESEIDEHDPVLLGDTDQEVMPINHDAEILVKRLQPSADRAEGMSTGS
jgi:hypothetical protein